MPKLISQINSPAVGIGSDGTVLGDAIQINFESNRVKYDSNTGIATVMSDPLSVIGL